MILNTKPLLLHLRDWRTPHKPIEGQNNKSSSCFLLHKSVMWQTKRSNRGVINPHHYANTERMERLEDANVVAPFLSLVHNFGPWKRKQIIIPINT
jgi:hypothetical protein